jgi:hypothetical protein
MNLRLAWNAQNFLIRWRTVNFSDRSLLHGISGKGWSQFQSKFSPPPDVNVEDFKCQSPCVWEESWCPLFPQPFLIKCDCGTLKHNLSKSVFFFRQYFNVRERGLAREWGEWPTISRTYLVRFSMLKQRCCAAAVSIFNGSIFVYLIIVITSVTHQTLKATRLHSVCWRRTIILSLKHVDGLLMSLFYRLV